ncbi:putative glycine synthase [Leishmania major strain Friedlin]|uniref:Aminomethyltransferase n=1 Tax=Leishmania major TaxID=5664 RepID=Q4Q134_LEIMA|nr:putative glycine synthase [Leishmania major strain Friedlin]CAG9583925.1 glycine_cleavage_complex_(GCC)_T-protein/GCVT-2 [Leishmania major strain Friedlin]CAJ09347.1 putative glycine synthase [Leishmania major strain Friedlin]|eukprot:XP_001686964.1 putative glycine synthase [Leishmania major strain Friedlin]
MSASLKKTALHLFHLAQQAKMDAFAGYHMPISYGRLGVLKEHLYTREVAGIFDVSHVGQYEVRGADRERFLEHVTPVDLQRIRAGHGALTMLTNAQGGIKDDCIVTKMADHLFLVLNAGCKEKDVAHMESVLRESAMKGADVQLVPLDRSLIALQGPQAAAILSEFMDDVPGMGFMQCRQRVNIKGMEVQVTRCGYTGEDGFELSVSNTDIVALVELLMSRKAEMIGLGARDSLRLEAGLNLYGHELTEDINPVAARFMWVISKRRMAEGGFIGYEPIKYLRDNASKGAVPRLRVGLVSTGPVAREKTVIEVGGKPVGEVTSGCPSPCLKKNIAIGYLDRELAKDGVKVDLVVRGRRVAAVVVTPPFVPARYYRKPK